MKEFFKALLEFLKECGQLLKIAAVTTKEGIESINTELDKFNESFNWRENMQSLFDELLQGKGHNIRYVNLWQLEEIENYPDVFTYVGEHRVGENNSVQYYVFEYKNNYFKIEKGRHYDDNKYKVSCWGKVKPKCLDYDELDKELEKMRKEVEKEYEEE